jgi:hypothetical protein
MFKKLILASALAAALIPAVASADCHSTRHFYNNSNRDWKFDIVELAPNDSICIRVNGQECVTSTTLRAGENADVAAYYHLSHYGLVSFTDHMGNKKILAVHNITCAMQEIAANDAVKLNSPADGDVRLVRDALDA